MQQKISDVLEKKVEYETILFETEELIKWFNIHGIFAKVREKCKRELPEFVLKEINHPEESNEQLLTEPNVLYVLNTDKMNTTAEETALLNSNENKTKELVEEVKILILKSKLEYFIKLKNILDSNGDIFIYDIDLDSKKKLSVTSKLQDRFILERNNFIERVLSDKINFKIENTIVIASLVEIETDYVKLSSDRNKKLMMKHLKNRTNFINIQVKTLKSILKLPNKEELTAEERQLQLKIKHEQTIRNNSTTLNYRKLVSMTRKIIKKSIDEGGTDEGIISFNIITNRIKKAFKHFSNRFLQIRDVVTIHYQDQPTTMLRKQLQEGMRSSCRGSLNYETWDKSGSSDVFLY